MEMADSLTELRAEIQSVKKGNKTDRLPKCRTCKHSLRKTEKTYCSDCKPTKATDTLEPPVLSPRPNQQSEEELLIPNTSSTGHNTRDSMPPAMGTPITLATPSTSQALPITTQGVAPMPWDQNPGPQPPAPQQFGEFLQWIMHSVQPSHPTKASGRKKRKTPAIFSDSSDSKEGLISESDEETHPDFTSDKSDHSEAKSDTDSEEENQSLLNPDMSKKLLRQMLQT